MVNFEMGTHQTVSSSILGRLSRFPKKTRLADLYKQLAGKGTSKTTIYRHLERLVKMGFLSKEGDHYALLANNDFTIIASDLSRISEVRPSYEISEKGLHISLYGSNKLKTGSDWKIAKAKINEHVHSILEILDPELNGIFLDDVNKEKIKNIYGRKIGMVVFFDGSNHVTFSPIEVINKRRQAMKILSELKEITIHELLNLLNVNHLQLRQIIDPLIIAGLASVDEYDKISLTLEVKFHEEMV